MTILPKRFQRLKSTLNCRMANLTVLIENVEKPHNISAILRSCDAVGVLEAHAICKEGKTPKFNSTAQGSQKWVRLQEHKNIYEAVNSLKRKGLKLYSTNIDQSACDYRDCDFTKPSAFVLGAEKWGLSEDATKLMDQSIFIPMRGMVQSLNVSVAAATLLFEALRQRKAAGVLPDHGEGISKEVYKRTLFEWAYPEVAKWCNSTNRNFPEMNEDGEIIEILPRTVKMNY